MKVIGGDGPENKNNDNNNKDDGGGAVTIVDGKKYCSFDSRLLIFREDLWAYFCPECGFTTAQPGKKQRQQQQSSGLRPSLSSANSTRDRTQSNPDNIDMKIVPMGRRKDDGLSKDPDVRRLQEKGYIITDHIETINDTGTFNAQRAMEEKQRRLTTTRNRYSSWTVS